MTVDEPTYEPYEKMLKEALKGELKAVNAFLPRDLKPISELLSEGSPHVICNDGSIHLFKKKELNYLSNLVDNDKQKTLLLPILIEISTNDEMTVIYRTGVEEEVISKILNMPVTPTSKGGRIYRTQLSTLRKSLKTTIQYVFSVNSIKS
ncbi:DUF61 family protein [Chloroflexota bacterium]